MTILRDYQNTAIDSVRAKLFREQKSSVVLQLPTGSGKCFGRDTTILMHDGTIKLVQDVSLGDKIMGYDSNPRTVASTTCGKEKLYKIIPVKGEPYIVNESHILSLKITNIDYRVWLNNKCFYSGNIANINLTDYLIASNTFKHVAKGWRKEVDFNKPAIDNPLPPYLLGLWLGDGSHDRPSITKNDLFLSNYLENYAKQYGLFVRVCNSNGTRENSLFLTSGRIIKKNPFWEALREFDLIRNKHIPLCYKTANKKERLELLAGLIDTDGSASKGGYDFITKHEKLADDICYLCRSLGLAAYKKVSIKSCLYRGEKKTGQYFRVYISGDCSIVPCKNPKRKVVKRKQKKDVLVTGIKIEELNIGDYYGFELKEENKLFLLGDFTVVHNTAIVSAISKSVLDNKKRVWFIVPRKELVVQSKAHFIKWGIRFGVIDADHEESRAYKAHIISLQTLMRRLDKIKEFPDICFFDECHLNYDAQEKIMRYFQCVQCESCSIKNGVRVCDEKQEPCQKIKSCDKWKVQDIEHGMKRKLKVAP